MKTTKTTLTNQCYHCGDPCGKNPVEYDEKEFCCQGCKTVYDIFRENDLENFYALQAAAGSTPKEVAGKYDYLRTDAIVEKLLSYKSDTLHIINLYIPPIHCSSCIWLLENLDKLAKGILQSEVDFPKKQCESHTILMKLTYMSWCYYSPKLATNSILVLKTVRKRSPQ